MKYFLRKHKNQHTIPWELLRKQITFCIYNGLISIYFKLNLNCVSDKLYYDLKKKPIILKKNISWKSRKGISLVLKNKAWLGLITNWYTCNWLNGVINYIDLMHSCVCVCVCDISIHTKTIFRPILIWKATLTRHSR